MGNRRKSWPVLAVIPLDKELVIKCRDHNLVFNRLRSELKHLNLLFLPNHRLQKMNKFKNRQPKNLHHLKNRQMLL